MVTVEQLIKALENLPPDTQVFVMGVKHRYYELQPYWGNLDIDSVRASHGTIELEPEYER